MAGPVSSRGTNASQSVRGSRIAVATVIRILLECIFAVLYPHGLLSDNSNPASHFRSRRLSKSNPQRLPVPQRPPSPVATSAIKVCVFEEKMTDSKVQVGLMKFLKIVDAPSNSKVTFDKITPGPLNEGQEE